MKQTLLLTSLIALTASTAMAADAPKPASTAPVNKGIFVMDANNDNAITLEEYQTFTKSGFMNMDKNKDGKITSDEAPPPPSTPAAAAPAPAKK